MRSISYTIRSFHSAYISSFQKLYNLLYNFRNAKILFSRINFSRTDGCVRSRAYPGLSNNVSRRTRSPLYRERERISFGAAAKRKGGGEDKGRRSIRKSWVIRSCRKVSEWNSAERAVCNRARNSRRKSDGARETKRKKCGARGAPSGAWGPV